MGVLPFLALFVAGAAALAGAMIGDLPDPWPISLLAAGIGLWMLAVGVHMRLRLRQARDMVLQSRRIEAGLRKEWLEREMLPQSADAPPEKAP